MFWILVVKGSTSFFRNLYDGNESQKFGYSFCHESYIESNLSKRFIAGKKFSEYQEFVQEYSTELL
jgi:hypothetical protein